MYKKTMNYRVKIPGMKSGFTLAEVLITLTIIGVIAALTIPALIQNIQDTQNRTAWRSADSIISQASRKLASDNGGSLSGLFNNSNEVRDRLSAYLGFTQKCDTATAVGSNGCWCSQMFNLAKTDSSFWDASTWARMILTNGMLVSFAAIATPTNSCTFTRAAKHNGCAQIGVDVNGFKGPNVVGKDIFFGFITEDGSFEPFGKTGDFWDTGGTVRGCDLNADSDAYGYTCAAQYLRQ